MTAALSSRRLREGRTPISSEIAAFLLVPAAAVGFIRIFEDPTAATTVMVAGGASSALAIALRRLRIPLSLAALISLAVMLVLGLNALAPGTARFSVLPTAETWELLRGITDDALTEFRTQRAPVDALSGFLAAASMGAWLCAFIVDWAALRLRLAFEPVLPAGLLFLFTAVTGSGMYQVSTTAVFAAAVVLWTVAHRFGRERQLLWLTADRRRGPARIASGAAAFSAVAVAVGLFAGPLLPGAGSSELLDWRNGGDPTRRVVSPFVSIADRLVVQKDVDLFRVRTERPSYYRLAGLDTYENADWISRGQNSRDEDGALPGARSSAGTTQVVTQTFEIQEMDGDWAPAAFAPSRIISTSVQFNWIAETGSLITDGSVPSVAGLQYEIESVVPIFTAAELDAANTDAPAEIRERYLDIPDNVSSVVYEIAESVTASGTTDYERMILLQNYFRQFDYSLDLGAQRGDPVEQFLSERVGFCQQFSGTFALMARALGIPSRVAVGYTWGEPVAGEPGVYQITGRHAHAWPEIYFNGLGWVAFEPTPQRGSPSGTGYTGVAAQQDDLLQPDNPFEATTTTTGPVNPVTPTTTNSPFEDPELAGAGGSAGDPTSGGFSLPWRWIGAALAAGGLSFGLPMLQQSRRTRRRRAAGTPADQVNTAWAEVAEAVERQLGILRSPSETRAAFAAELANQYPFRTLPVTDLGTLATAARYAPEQVSQTSAATAWVQADQILEKLRSEQSALNYWLQEADPRRLFRPTVRIRTQ